MHNGFSCKCKTCCYAQSTIYSAGTMLSLFVTSSCCRGKGNTETSDTEEFFLLVVYMQVRGWKDVCCPREKPEDKDNMGQGFNGNYSKPVFIENPVHHKHYAVHDGRFIRLLLSLYGIELIEFHKSQTKQTEDLTDSSIGC